MTANELTVTYKEEPPAPNTVEEKSLEVIGLSKWFGSERVLDDVSFSINEGESLVLLGHSGSGKSTTLRIIAGLETPDSGEINLHGRNIINLRARDRNMGVIFQNYALFPRMTVAENIGFGLKIRGVKKSERRKIIGELLTLTGLQEHHDKYPWQISGGQQQRVAIARSLAYKPVLLLFDESFSALDPQTRKGLRRDIKSLLQRVKVPALFITHDQEEAMELGDHIAILNHGRLEQIGTPDEIYNDPQTEFVARFLGAANVLRGYLREGMIALDCDRLLSPPSSVSSELSSGLPSELGEIVKIVFRPEDIILAPTTGLIETPYHLGCAQITDISFTGATESLTVKLLSKENGEIEAEPLNGDCSLKVLRTKWDARKLQLQPGDLVSVGLKSYKILKS